MGPLVPLAINKLLGFATSRFSSHVIERWTQHRAQKFIEAFCEDVALGRSSEAQESLDAIFESEGKTEALFEAYRSVVLAKTKSVGPRALGFLTARIINEGRTATEREEAWGQFFESASDVEMVEVKKFFALYLSTGGHRREPIEVKGDSIVIEWSNEHADSFSSQAVDQTFNLHHVGQFAARLYSLGIILASVEQQLQHFDDNGKRTVEMAVRYLITLQKGDLEFVALIERALHQSE
jgi:hypothetical protein